MINKSKENQYILKYKKNLTFSYKIVMSLSKNYCSKIFHTYISIEKNAKYSLLKETRHKIIFITKSYM